MSWDQDLEKWRNKAQTLLAPPSGLNLVKSCKSVLPHAANIIEWTINPEFLNAPQVISKYVRQYQILRDTGQLYCPVCNSMAPEAIDCWGKTRMELESQVLLRWRETYNDEVCPKCGGCKQQFIEDGMLEPIDTLIGISGMRSGKSVCVAIMNTYIEHELCIIGDIHKYFDILPADPIQMSFVATTQTQSKETVFAKFRALRAESPWFNKYVPWVKIQEKNQVAPSGVRKWEYGEDTGDKIENGLIGLQIKSLNSNSSGLAGATRVSASIDELSRFDSSESKQSASEIVKVMMQGLKTCRSAKERLKLRPFWGLFAAVSSPISVDDLTMTMVKQKIKGQYSFHYASWEFNPDLPRQSFDSDFERDSVGAARDFGAQPPFAETPWIDDPARFRQAIDFKTLPTCEFQRTEPVDKTDRKYVGAKVAKVTYDPHYTHYLHFDAGASFDTFAGASAHGEWVTVTDPQSGQLSKKFITVFDWVLGIKPVLGKTMADKRTVWFQSIVEILATLSKQTRIGRVTFDRWNAEKLIQDIRELGVQTDNRSIKTKDYMDFLRACYDGDIRLLPPRQDEPTDSRQKNDQEKAIYELLRLERSPDLAKIYNPKKGQVHGMNSDDLAQVVIGAHMGVQSSIVAISDSTSIKEVLRREQAGSSQYDENRGGSVVRGRRW